MEISSLTQRREMDCFSPAFLLFVALFFLAPGPSSSALDSTQRPVMANLSLAFRPSSWSASSTSDPCDWKGVTCSVESQRKVTHLSLSGLGQSDSKSLRLICELHSLESLNLAGNSFTNITDDFIRDCGKLPGLKVLNFSRNIISGSLPNFREFRALEILDFSYNLLKGSVSSKGLGKLRSLNLSFNGLSDFGSNESVGSLSLKELSLSNNKLGGNILSRILIHKNLSFLDLSSNNLTGPVPRSIADLSKLEALLLSYNSLTGEVPQALSTLKNLRRFVAAFNQRWTSASIGSTPSRGPTLSQNLESVDLSSNSLQGSIPGNISGRLFRLWLGENRLAGEIPPAVGNLSRLAYLDLGDNKLEGNIPSQLGNLHNLTQLKLSGNKLEGSIPRELGNLRNLVVLELQRNQIQGEIPDEIFHLKNLLILNLSWNSLSGAIPSSIIALSNLSILNLEGNQLNGSIPGDIGTVQTLKELRLGSNRLSGDIPKMPIGLSISLNLSRNIFRGLIPEALGDLSQLEVLDLSHNEFSGEVPSSLVQMRSLTLLVLSYNQLSGRLPQFSRFVSVDISGNQGLLNGTISIKGKSKALNIIIIIFSAVVAFLVCCFVSATALFVGLRRFRRVENRDLPPAGVLTEVIDSCLLGEGGERRSHIDFAKAMEEVANPRNLLRKNRFSTEFKVSMPGGACYCVKKLDRNGKIFQIDDLGRFSQEMAALGKLRNSCVTVPLAYAVTVDSAFLFYEESHKGALFDFLHGVARGSLGWPSRYIIALGVARGMTFLHGCSQSVLLLDLSTKTILLKTSGEPQIAEIELHQVIGASKSMGSVSTLAGSVGYVPPEYAYTMRVTAAGNVYSFGVVLLELLTGRPPVAKRFELVKWAMGRSSWPSEWERILDQSVSGESSAVRSQMLSVLKIALSCVNYAAKERPSARHLLRMLFNAR
ncbi:unnamed protein product [Spirodela intermedia]|uniref:Protein kinase domain-containing protein n=1 Tax=Spirodela intermedia TaxID=51605 RepID=A0A7I8ITD2_SPIIN|nr:unnamed protein product [Spirodela intermedia]CAA6660395.1 unnamed protein product [Spirodela intermedia]